MAKCVQCKGEIVFGEPHIMRVTENGVTRKETWCRTCMEAYASALWDDDELGPYPAKISRIAGRA